MRSEVRVLYRPLQTPSSQDFRTQGDRERNGCLVARVIVIVPCGWSGTADATARLPGAPAVWIVARHGTVADNPPATGIGAAGDACPVAMLAVPARVNAAMPFTAIALPFRPTQTALTRGTTLPTVLSAAAVPADVQRIAGWVIDGFVVVALIAGARFAVAALIAGAVPVVVATTPEPVPVPVPVTPMPFGPPPVPTTPVPLVDPPVPTTPAPAAPPAPETPAPLPEAPCTPTPLPRPVPETPAPFDAPPVPETPVPAGEPPVPETPTPFEGPPNPLTPEPLDPPVPSTPIPEPLVPKTPVPVPWPNPATPFPFPAPAMLTRPGLRRCCTGKRVP